MSVGTATPGRILRGLGLVVAAVGIGVGCHFEGGGNFVPDPDPNTFFVGCFEGVGPTGGPRDLDLTLILRAEEDAAFALEGCFEFGADGELKVATLVGGVDPDDEQRADLNGEGGQAIRLLLTRQPAGDVDAETLEAVDDFGLFMTTTLERCDPEQAFEDLCTAALFAVAPAN